ncbi:MAG: hypothetical protein CMJ18_23885 [Phycisphaeraceae bacterium]|nr:hypothetical protein [Phycisphaeraceae bacterium]
MAHVGLLQGRLDMASVLPATHARYSAIVGDALRFFVDHLSPARRARIDAEQAEMPAASDMAERLVGVMHRCPTLHKLGQVVARDRRLPLAFRLRLQRLETMEPVTPRAVAEGVVREELGDLAQLGLTLEGGAVAEASVAIVLPVMWEDRRARRPGVLKVLKPGVEQCLREELDVLVSLGAFLDERCETDDLPPIDYEATFDRVRRLLTSEIHFDVEQAHLATAGRMYAHVAQVRVPELWPFRTSRVTAMERLHGRKVTDVGCESPGTRRRLAETIVESLIALPMHSMSDVCLVHGDPHAGNLMMMTEGTLGLLDWSLAIRLTRRVREQIAGVLRSALTFDERRLATALRELAEDVVDGQALARVATAGIRAVPPGGWPGLRWLVGLLDDAVRTRAARFGDDLLMLRKSLFTLEGIVADVSNDCRIDDVLQRAFLAELLREVPRRLVTGAFSRDLPTRLSNMDLVEVLFAAPRAWMRFMGGIQKSSAGASPFPPTLSCADGT